MLAANNVVDVFDYLFPIVAKKLNNKMEDLIDKQNSTGNTPLRMDAVIKIMQLLLIVRTWSPDC
mgnify:CR=1 FL=1